MFSSSVYAILRKQIRSVETGIKRVRINDDQTGIIFTANDDRDLLLPVPNLHKHNNKTVLEKFEVIDGKIYFDGKLLISTDNLSSADISTIKSFLSVYTDGGDGKKFLADDGTYKEGLGGTLSDDLVATVDLNAVKKGKVYTAGTPLEAIIRDMLIKEEAPTVTLTLNPSKLLYDVVSETLTNLVLTATVTKKTYPPTNVKYYIDDVVVNSRNITDKGTFSYTHTFTPATNTDKVLKLVVTDGKLSSTATKTIKFVGKTYYGTIDASIGTPTEAQVKALQNNTLKDVKGFVYSGITMDYGKVVYAYPQSFGALTSIKDEPNNIVYTASFSRVSATIDNIPYYIYTQTDPSASDNVKLTFS